MAFNLKNQAEMRLNQIESVCLVLRPGQQKAASLSNEVTKWFAARGIQAWQAKQKACGEISWMGHIAPDLVLVLGGDGTMLGALRAVIGTNIPVLGINLGQVGFLAGVAEKTWQEDLRTALSDGLDLQKCLVLDWQVERKGEVIEKGQAVNDVVLRYGKIAKLISLQMHIDREDVGTLRADGLVVATPTGSSGYAFSAGGPLVYPDVDAFILAPICPFLNRMPPLIVGPKHAVWLDVDLDSTGIFLTSDGQEGFPLEPGDRISITKSPSRALMGFLPQSSYFAVLRDRGFIRET